jgi:hypothetical protein
LPEERLGDLQTIHQSYAQEVVRQWRVVIRLVFQCLCKKVKDENENEKEKERARARTKSKID